MDCSQVFKVILSCVEAELDYSCSHESLVSCVQTKTLEFVDPKLIQPGRIYILQFPVSVYFPNGFLDGR